MPPVPLASAEQTGTAEAACHIDVYQAFFSQVGSKSNETYERFVQRLPTLNDPSLQHVGTASDLVPSNAGGPVALAEPHLPARLKQQEPKVAAAKEVLQRIFKTPEVDPLRLEWEHAAGEGDEDLPTEEGDWVDTSPPGGKPDKDDEELDENGIPTVRLRRASSGFVLDGPGQVQVDNFCADETEEAVVSPVVSAAVSETTTGAAQHGAPHELPAPTPLVTRVLAAASTGTSTAAVGAAGGGNTPSSDLSAVAVVVETATGVEMSGYVPSTAARGTGHATGHAAAPTVSPPAEASGLSSAPGPVVMTLLEELRMRQAAGVSGTASGQAPNPPPLSSAEEDGEPASEAEPFSVPPMAAPAAATTASVVPATAAAAGAGGTSGLSAMQVLQHEGQVWALPGELIAMHEGLPYGDRHHGGRSSDAGDTDSNHSCSNGNGNGAGNAQHPVLRQVWRTPANQLPNFTNTTGGTVAAAMETGSDSDFETADVAALLVHAEVGVGEDHLSGATAGCGAAAPVPEEPTPAAAAVAAAGEPTPPTGAGSSASSSGQDADCAHGGRGCTTNVDRAAPAGSAGHASVAQQRHLAAGSTAAAAATTRSADAEGGASQVEPFSLDPDFDYDNVKLTPRFWPR